MERSSFDVFKSNICHLVKVQTFTDSVIRLHFAREKKTLDEALCRLEKMKECFRSY